MIPGFESSISLTRISDERSDNPVAPAVATDAVPLVAFKPWVRAEIPFNSPLRPCPIAKLEASDSAPVTFSPVETRFWVVELPLLIELMLRNDAKTEELVFTELMAILPTRPCFAPRTHDACVRRPPACNNYISKQPHIARVQIVDFPQKSRKSENPHILSCYSVDSTVPKP